eukprot:2072677-Amphidinium_carterae.1
MGHITRTSGYNAFSALLCNSIWALWLHIQNGHKSGFNERILEQCSRPVCRSRMYTHACTSACRPILIGLEWNAFNGLEDNCLGLHLYLGLSQFSIEAIRATL